MVDVLELTLELTQALDIPGLTQEMAPRGAPGLTQELDILGLRWC